MKTGELASEALVFFLQFFDALVGQFMAPFPGLLCEALG